MDVFLCLLLVNIHDLFLKKNAQNNTKQKHIRLILTQKKMLITCELRSNYFYESVIARKNRRYVWWPRAATQNFSFSKIE